VSNASICGKRQHEEIGLQPACLRAFKRMQIQMAVDVPYTRPTFEQDKGTHIQIHSKFKFCPVVLIHDFTVC